MPPSGTMAHSFISSFLTEKEAFRAYAHSFPKSTVLLLDTYDTISGARHAVEIGLEMAASGHRMAAVRLDSGDFDQLSRQVRQMLDQAGLEYVKIIASGGLDEYEIDRLVQGGAPIDMFGVGTKVGVSADAPWSDMAYKLVSFDQRPVMKLSTGKAYLPWGKQVFRRQDPGGTFSGDVIGLAEESQSDARPLLQPVMAQGRRTGRPPGLEESRQLLLRELGQLGQEYQRLTDPGQYPVEYSARLLELAKQVEGGIQWD
jgi:nicotinate phosphoribosyltransferase